MREPMGQTNTDRVLFTSVEVEWLTGISAHLQNRFIRRGIVTPAVRSGGGRAKATLWNASQCYGWCFIAELMRAAHEDHSVLSVRVIKRVMADIEAHANDDYFRNIIREVDSPEATEDYYESERLAAYRAATALEPALWTQPDVQKRMVAALGFIVQRFREAEATATEVKAEAPKADPSSRVVPLGTGMLKRQKERTK